MARDLEAVRDSVLTYLNYLEERRRPGFAPPEPVEEPYYYALHEALKSFGGPYRAGGFEDQPYLLTQALMAAEAGVAQWESFRRQADEAGRRVTRTVP